MDVSIVEQHFDRFVDALPHGFGLGETYSSLQPSVNEQRFSVERWVLHQITFSVMLDFISLSLDLEQRVPVQTVVFANYILDLQTRLRYRCDVVDSLSANVESVRKAVTVLVIDLIHCSETISNLVRQLTLGRIHDALARCQKFAGAGKVDFGTVLALLDAEGQIWRSAQSRKSGQISSTHGGSSTPLLASSTDASSVSQLLTPATSVDFVHPPMPTQPLITQSFVLDDGRQSLPRDTGINPALHAGSETIDALLAEVTKFLDDHPLQA